MNSTSFSRTCSRVVLLPLLLLCVPTSLRAEGDSVHGKAVYETHCATCHGITGEGNGPSARPLKPKPRNFKEGTFKFRSTENGTLPTDADLLRSVRLGMAGTMMPAWEGLLTEQQMEDAVATLKAFSPRFQNEKPGVEIHIVPEPASSEDGLQRGAQLYIDLGCVSCHGVGGKGNGPSAATLRDQWGDRIPAADLTQRRLKSGPNGEDLYRTLMTGLDGSPMPSFAGQLTPEDAWAVVHYIQSLRGERGFWKKLIVGE